MNEVTPALPANGSAKPAERRVRHGLIEDWRDAVGILLLLLVAAFFGAVIARFWPEADDTHAVAELSARLGAVEASQGKPISDLAAVRGRLSNIEKRLATAEAVLASGAIPGNLAGLNLAPGAASGPAAGSALSQLGSTNKLLEDLAARLAALETKTADVQATKDSLATLTANVTELSTRIATFGERVVKLESSDLLLLARRASLATAVANLTRAAQGSSPFKTEYDVVAAMTPDDQALREIQAHIGGLPTTGTLIAMFGEASDVALDAETIANSGGNMWSGLWANFIATISARPTGEVAGNSTAERIARAEVRMKAGDLAAAVKELGAIRGAARGPLQPWLAQASARVRLEAALAKLNTQAVAALSAPTSNETVPQLPTP